MDFHSAISSCDLGKFFLEPKALIGKPNRPPAKWMDALTVFVHHINELR